MKLQKITALILSLTILLSATTALSSCKQNNKGEVSVKSIVIGVNATEMEKYAAQELQRYFYQMSDEVLPIITDEQAQSQTQSKEAYIIGKKETNKRVSQYITDENNGLGAQGYTLKTFADGGNTAMIISAIDDEGCLYGVYGLLDDYYGMGFYFSGDVFPGEKSPIEMKTLNESKTPNQYIRGILPWTNFPQSATSYSLNDWLFIIDQLAKMRMNFLNIHNYNEEMMFSFEYNGIEPRTYMATANIGHAWNMEGYDVNNHKFGASALFDDYDFGADCALHNFGLETHDANMKALSEFKLVIDYAHKRGVKICLGMDIDTGAERYGTDMNDDAFIEARTDALMELYPDLDYFAAFRNEGSAQVANEAWTRAFNSMYNRFKEKESPTKIIVSGWGMTGESVADLPMDVIIAPIAPYSAWYENEKTYGGREYWAGPWAQRDFTSSVYYYPYLLHLDETMESYAKNKENTKGIFMLTWTLTDAVAPRFDFIAKAPWQKTGYYDNPYEFYYNYAVENYGEAAASEVAKIMNRNEPMAVDYSECQDSYGLYRIVASYANLSDEYKQVGVYLGDERVQTLLVKPTTEEQPITETELYLPRSTKDGFSFRIDEEDYISNNGELALSLNMIIAHGWANPTNYQNWQLVGCETAVIESNTVVSGLDQIGDMIILPEFSRADDIDKATEQLEILDKLLNEMPEGGNKARLNRMRARIDAVKNYCVVEEEFGSITWEKLPGAFENWAVNFITKTDDLSSLGNVVSTQNRWVNTVYDQKENELRATQSVKAPANLTAKATKDGAYITWTNKQPKNDLSGFNIYADGEKLNQEPIPPNITEYNAVVKGEKEITVTAVSKNGEESPKAVRAKCQTGGTDSEKPQIFVISPPQSTYSGQIELTARVLDNASNDSISATMFYRNIGEKNWQEITMERRSKAIFTVNLLIDNTTEWYIKVSDGINTAYYPDSAPAVNMTTVNCGEPKNKMAAPVLSYNGEKLTWSKSEGAYWYKIYRSENENFTPAKATYLTYVSDATTYFSDHNADFNGNIEIGKEYYYKVTAMDKSFNESLPSKAVPATFSKYYVISNADDADLNQIERFWVLMENGRAIQKLDGKQIRFADMNFGSGAEKISLLASSRIYNEAKIYINSTDETNLLGIAVIDSENPSEYTFSEINFNKITGIHDIYIVFEGSNVMVQGILIR